jgi:hypothetical protein
MIEVLKVIREENRKSYVYKKEVWLWDEDTVTIEERAYNTMEHYIGTIEVGEILRSRGIVNAQLAHPDHSICSIGFNTEKKKWYGWSMEQGKIRGFGTGSRYKGVRSTNLSEAKHLAKAYVIDLVESAKK